MSAKVAFLERPVAADEERPRTAINPSAIVTKDGKKFVFIIKDGRAVETPITTGRHLGDMIEVTGGIKAGDKIVVKPSNKLKTGSKIKVAEQ
jgi:multidrug efflux pump subunit AcrA (membrane-fusion protein)